MFWEVKIKVIVRGNFPKMYHPNIPFIPNTDPKLRLEDCNIEDSQNWPMTLPLPPVANKKPRRGGNSF